MHVCHLLLIEAEDADDAIYKVKLTIEPDDGNYLI